MRKSYVYIALLMLFFILISGCSNSSSEKTERATISVNADSDYVNTFEDLHLGILFDFDFKLPHADNRWVTLWVERYENGEEVPSSLDLRYGMSPEEVETGQIGFGIINPNSEGEAMAFLYGPNVSIQPSIIELEDKSGVFSSWDYAIDEEELELDLDETYLLAAYREKKSDSIRTIDLQNDAAVNQMIEEDDLVLLLKIKVEESQ